MWVLSALIQPLALLCLVLSALRYTGRRKTGLEGRGRGWPFFRTLAAWAPLQGFAMIGVALHLDEPGWGGYDALMLASLTMILIVPWPLLVFGYFWAPGFLLPGWVRERLRHGDPVQTSAPPEQIQPHLRHRRNQPPSEEERMAKQISAKHVVDVGGWVIGAVATTLSALVLLSVSVDVGPLAFDIGDSAPIRPGAVTTVTSENIQSLRIRYGAVGLLCAALACVFAPRVLRQIRRARAARTAENQERAAHGLPAR